MRFGSLQRFPNRAEPRSLALPKATKTCVLRVLSPSRHFAPRAISQAYFILNPLLGFCPPRIYSCVDVGDSFELRDPHGLLPSRFNDRAVPSGLCPSTQLRPPAKVIHPPSCASLPGLSLLRGLLPRAVTKPRYFLLLTVRALRLGTPLMHFARVAFMLATQPVLQGFSSTECIFSLSRSECPLGVFHLVNVLNSSIVCVRWVLSLPSRNSSKLFPSRAQSVTKLNDRSLRQQTLCQSSLRPLLR